VIFTKFVVGLFSRPACIPRNRRGFRVQRGTLGQAMATNIMVLVNNPGVVPGEVPVGVDEV
jgi:hypothetical protein